MPSSHPRRSGAQVLIDQLRIHGTDTIFGHSSSADAATKTLSIIQGMK